MPAKNRNPESGALSFRIAKTSLTTALQKLRPLKGGNSLPVLSCVKLTVTAEELSAVITNLAQFAEVRVPLSPENVTTPGIVVVSIDRLLDLVKLAQEDELDLRWRANSLTVRCGDWSATLLTLDSADFPPWPEWAAGASSPSLPIAERALRRMLTLCLPSVSTDETRYGLNGVMLHTNRESLTAEATDGRRLTRTRCALPSEHQLQIILPTSTARSVLGFIGAGAEVVTLQVNQSDAGVASAIQFFGDHFLLASKLIEGNWPNTDQVFPPARPHIGIDRAKLVEMLTRAAVMAPRKDHTVNVAMDKTGTVSVSSQHPEVGDWTESAPVCHADSRPEKVVKFVVNAHYIAPLAGPETEAIRLNTPEPKGPLLWFATEDGEPQIDYQMIVMPMNTAEEEKADSNPNE